MFDSTSRYYALETAVFTAPDGRQIPYKRRRFVPQSGTLQIIGHVTVSQGDRLDLITGRTFGAPEQFWQICDANVAMNPFDLTGDAAVGASLDVAMPQAPKA
jgi:hypothetical protein